MEFSTTLQLGYTLFLKIFWQSTLVSGQCRTLTKLVDMPTQLRCHPIHMEFLKILLCSENEVEDDM
jgi:hypothetical protein